MLPPGRPMRSWRQKRVSLFRAATKVRADLAAVAALDEASITNRLGISFADLSLRRGLMQRLAQLYEQQISYTAELEALKSRRAEVSREAKAWAGFTEPRPYSILLADSLRESALSMLTKLTDEQRELERLRS